MTVALEKGVDVAEAVEYRPFRVAFSLERRRIVQDTLPSHFVHVRNLALLGEQVERRAVGTEGGVRFVFFDFRQIVLDRCVHSDAFNFRLACAGNRDAVLRCENSTLRCRSIVSAWSIVSMCRSPFRV